jgi:hypothetical protein
MLGSEPKRGIVLMPRPDRLTRRRPGRSRSRGRSRRRCGLGRHCGRRWTSRRRLFLRHGLLARRRRRCRLQFHKHRIGNQARVLLGGGDDAHGHGLRLEARKSEAYGKLARRHRDRARRSAGLPQRGAGFGAGRLGLELHIHRGGGGLQEPRRVERHPAWHSGARGKTQPAGCDRDNPFHDRHVPHSAQRSLYN